MGGNDQEAPGKMDSGQVGGSIQLPEGGENEGAKERQVD